MSPMERGGFFTRRDITASSTCASSTHKLSWMSLILASDSKTMLLYFVEQNGMKEGNGMEGA